MDRTVVSVPNGQLSVMSLENFAMRDKMRFSHTVGLGRETTPGALRRVLTDMDRMLQEHGKVEAPRHGLPRGHQDSALNWSCSHTW